MKFDKISRKILTECEIDTTAYKYATGKEPDSKATGSWAFDIDGFTFFADSGLTYTDAIKQAKKEYDKKDRRRNTIKVVAQ